MCAIYTQLTYRQLTYLLTYLGPCYIHGERVRKKVQFYELA